MGDHFITRKFFGTKKARAFGCDKGATSAQDQILHLMTALESSGETREQIHKNYQRLHAQYFDQKTSIVSAVVLGYKEGVPHVYLARRVADGFLCLPGGRLDPRGYGRQRCSTQDETPLRAIVGEIKEETCAVFEEFPHGLRPSFKCNFPLSFPDVVVRPRVEIFCFKTNFEALAQGNIGNNDETDGAFWVRLSDALRSTNIKKYYKTSIIKALFQRLREHQFKTKKSWDATNSWPLSQEGPESEREDRSHQEQTPSALEITAENIDDIAMCIENSIPTFALKTSPRVANGRSASERKGAELFWKRNQRKQHSSLAEALAKHDVDSLA